MEDALHLPVFALEWELFGHEKVVCRTSSRDHLRRHSLGSISRGVRGWVGNSEPDTHNPNHAEAFEGYTLLIFVNKRSGKQTGRHLVHNYIDESANESVIGFHSYFFAARPNPSNPSKNIIQPNDCHCLSKQFSRNVSSKVNGATNDRFFLVNSKSLDPWCAPQPITIKGLIDPNRSYGTS